MFDLAHDLWEGCGKLEINFLIEMNLMSLTYIYYKYLYFYLQASYEVKSLINYLVYILII